MIYTSGGGNGWSEWKRKFAYIPHVVARDASGKLTWMWWEWVEMRSRWGGQYKEYRAPGSDVSAVVDLTY